MSEEQLKAAKAAEAEATAEQVEDSVSEEDLAGVAAGGECDLPRPFGFQPILF